MKTRIHIAVALLAGLLLAGCGSGLKADEPGGEEPQKVRLNIRVAVADDAPVRGTRAGDAEAASDDERMRTLRVVVVRPDGTVEANRFVRLTAAVLTYGCEPIEVRANEQKRIYLLANEESTRLTDGATAVADTWALFDALRAGSAFPQERIEGLTIGLDGASQQLAGPLPMNECHTVQVGDEDQEIDLFVTRAAVKFTFRIRSASGASLTGLAIEKMAPRAYYLPRAEYDEQQHVDSYEVPQGDTYYRFELAEAKLPVRLETAKTVELEPIYLLEGKYSDPKAPAGKSSYRISLDLDGRDDLLTGYLDNLPALPRNTHAVVTITIGDGKPSFTVDVLPYGEVVLEPGFGI